MQGSAFIRAYENETLSIVNRNPVREKKEITHEEADAIEALVEFEDLEINESKWARRTRGNKLKLGQYVGLITVGDLSIEILAKVEKETEYGPKTDLRGLIELYLSETGKSVFSAKAYDQKGATDPEIFKHLVRNFFERVNRSLNFGLRSEYQTKEERRDNLKGRVNFKELARMAGNNPGQIPCVFDEFTQDTLHNQIIKQAVSILSKQRDVMSGDRKLLSSAAGILDQLEHVSDTQHRHQDIATETADRLESDHIAILEFAKKVIAGNAAFLRGDAGAKAKGFTMVWEMSAIYEKAIWIKVKSFVKDHLPKGCRVVEQGKLGQEEGFAPGHTRWNSYLSHSTPEPVGESPRKTPPGVFRLKPDIMILSPENEVLAVLDTKWKNYSGAEAIKQRRRKKRTNNEPEVDTYKNVSKEDAYQMLAYACAKKSRRDHPEPLVGLLFPSLGPTAPEELFFTNLKSRILLCWVPVTADGLSNFNLVDILGEKTLLEMGMAPAATATHPGVSA